MWQFFLENPRVLIALGATLFLTRSSGIWSFAPEDGKIRRLTARDHADAQLVIPIVERELAEVQTALSSVPRGLATRFARREAIGEMKHRIAVLSRQLVRLRAIEGSSDA
jgi:hypothetical protein